VAASADKGHLRFAHPAVRATIDRTNLMRSATKNGTPNTFLPLRARASTHDQQGRGPGTGPSFSDRARRKRCESQLRVRSGNPQSEHSESALPPKADLRADGPSRRLRTIRLRLSPRRRRDRQDRGRRLACDRQPVRAVAHRALRRQTAGAPQLHRAHPGHDPVQASEARKGRAAQAIGQAQIR